MFAQIKLQTDAVKVEKLKPIEIRSEANYRKISRITKYKKLARSKIKKELKKFSAAQILAMADKEAPAAWQPSNADVCAGRNGTGIRTLKRANQALFCLINVRRFKKNRVARSVTTVAWSDFGLVAGSK
ncbi:MAG: hypothetical protein ACLU99_06405 [Alphaproteobacteria bacterium]